MSMPQHTFKSDHETLDLRAYTRGLYIDGQWRQAADGRLIEVVDPSTEARDRRGARCGHGRRRGSAWRPPPGRRAGWSATPPRKRSEILRRCFELMTSVPETLADADLARERQGVARCARRGRLCRRVLSLERRGSRANHRRIRPRSFGREPHHRRLPADRHLRADHAVELPGGHGDAQDRSRAGRRLHRHPQARDRDAAHRLCARRAL